MRRALCAALLVIGMLFTAGCFGGNRTPGNGGLAKLAVTWRNENVRDNAKASMYGAATVIANAETDIDPELELSVSGLSYTDTPLEGGVLIAEARIEGSAPASTFEFGVVSQNEYEIQGDRVTILREIAEQGQVYVKYGDLELVAPFRIFDAMAIGSVATPARDIYTHYDFEGGPSNSSGDLYMTPGSADIWATYGYATLPKGDAYGGFWGDFPANIDLGALEYSTGSFAPNYEMLYCVKTSRGFARLIFTSYQQVGGLDAHNFIYDYVVSD